MKKIFGILSLLFLILVFSALSDSQIKAEDSSGESGQAEVSGPGQLYALSAVLMDGDSGRVLFEKNGYEKRPMASTTKIMTLIVTLENANLDEIVTVSDYAASMPDVQLGIRAGEQYRLEDLLYSLMLESHNDSAAAIAEHVGGSVEGFAAMMNAKARDIGCYDTYYITPNGLDAEDENGVHSTTAADLARVMRYCISQSPEKDEFLKITRTNAYSFSDAECLRNFTVGNKNAFLGMMEGALSGKTGFTNNAGYCYVGALERDGRTFIVSLLACGWPDNKTWKWHDAQILMEYGLQNYEKYDIYQAKELEPVPVSDGQEAEVFLTAEAKKIELLLGPEDEVKVEWTLPDHLEAPVEKGDEVGKQSYFVNGELYAFIPVKAGKTVLKITYPYCVRRVVRMALL